VKWSTLSSNSVVRTCVEVAWLDHGSIPLTYEERRVVDDARFMIVRPYDKEWNLQIRNIQPEDQGQYRCTINTSPVKSKVIMLHVKGFLPFLRL